MIRASWQIRIDRPREQVFDYVADLDNMRVWNPSSQRFRTTVVQTDRPRELVLDARTNGAYTRVRFRFEAAGSTATEVACESELTLRGARRLLGPLLAAAMRRATETTRAAGLKAALERD